MLGKRKQSLYGAKTLEQIQSELMQIASSNNFKIIFFQSNHEGELIDFIQQQANNVGGILINAGALSHYSYSLRDALIDTNLPIVNVHLSNIYEREKFRHNDILKDITIDSFVGLKENSYKLGLKALIEYVKKHHPNRHAGSR